MHVGPDCTCVKSRMRTPSNALPITFPYAYLYPPEAALHAASPGGGERLGGGPAALIFVPPEAALHAASPGGGERLGGGPAALIFVPPEAALGAASP